jgi:photosystem II stability/assembly factor-like uncharacterized protein
MRKITILILFILSSMNYVYTQSGWYVQNIVSVWPLQGIHFFNQNTGYMIGASGIAFYNFFKTTNAGLQWNLFNDGAIGNLYSLEFLNLNTGYVGGSSRVFRKTTNGGLNWVSRNIPSGSVIWQISFLNIDTGMVTIGSANVYKTTNGGINWLTITLNPNHFIYGISMVNYDTIVLVGGAPGINNSLIMLSTDSGINWSETIISQMSFSFVKFLNDKTGYACGAAGKIYKTINSGVDWSL